MKLLLGLEIDYRQINLPFIKKVTIIIPDEYNQSGFYNIILAYCHLENNSNQYHIISSNSMVYMLLHYILFFSRSNLRWHWILTLQDLDS